MAKKPTYEELEQRVKELENEALGRKQVEEELRESEEKFRHLVKNSNDVFVIIDENGKEIFVSRFRGTYHGVYPGRDNGAFRFRISASR